VLPGLPTNDAQEAPGEEETPPGEEEPAPNDPKPEDEEKAA